MVWDWAKAQGLIDALTKKGGLSSFEVHLLSRLCSSPFLRLGRAHFAIGVVQAKVFLKHLSPEGYSELVEHAEASDRGDVASACSLAENILEFEKVDITRARVFAAAKPGSSACEDLTAEICPEVDEWCGATLGTMYALYMYVDDIIASTGRGSAGTPVLGLRPYFVRVAILRGGGRAGRRGRHARSARRSHAGRCICKVAAKSPAQSLCSRYSGR